MKETCVEENQMKYIFYIYLYMYVNTIDLCMYVRVLTTSMQNVLYK